MTHCSYIFCLYRQNGCFSLVGYRLPLTGGTGFLDGCVFLWIGSHLLWCPTHHLMYLVLSHMNQSSWNRNCCEWHTSLSWQLWSLFLVLTMRKGDGSNLIHTEFVTLSLMDKNCFTDLEIWDLCSSSPVCMLLHFLFGLLINFFDAWLINTYFHLW